MRRGVGCWSLFQPHLLLADSASGPGSWRARWPRRTSSLSLTSTARERAGASGVTGKLVVDALAELRPGMPLAWTPRRAEDAVFVARRARRGDIVLAQGATTLLKQPG